MAKIQIADLTLSQECESFFADLQELTQQDLSLVMGGLASSDVVALACLDCSV